MRLTIGRRAPGAEYSEDLVLCTLYFVLCTLSFVLCPLYFVLCTLSLFLGALGRVLCLVVEVELLGSSDLRS